MGIHPEIRRFFRTICFPVLFMGILWLIWGLDTMFELDFYKGGILARDIKGIWGIFLSPLIHSNFNHLASNSIPLFILGVIMFSFYRKIAFSVFIVVYLTTGLSVWLFARGGAYHIGASGLIYAFVCFLFYSGVFRKSRKLLALSLLVTFLYGSLIFGVTPFSGRKISWESHLIGSISGGITAWLLRKRGPANDRYTWDDEEEAEAMALAGQQKSMVIMPSNGFSIFPIKPEWENKDKAA